MGASLLALAKSIYYKLYRYMYRAIGSGFCAVLV